jgi:hypothetical protein
VKRPSFQFYPADWRNNAKLRRCSEAARGAWMDVLCVLHDMDEYGICRWPLADLARSANINLKLVKELVDKDVLKGADKDAEPYIFTPRHAGKDGEPVTLVENNGQPLWYCSRFVRDEYIRQRRGQSTRFDEENQPPKAKPKSTPKPPIGDELGDGSTSTSSSTYKPNELTHSNETGNTVEPTLAARVCLAIKELGYIDINPSHSRLQAMLNAGATLEEFVNAAKVARPSNKKFVYLLGTVEGMRKQAAAENVTQGNFAEAAAAKAWRKSDVGIMEKAKELRIGTAGLNKFQLLEKIDAKLEQIDREEKAA